LDDPRIGHGLPLFNKGGARHASREIIHAEDPRGPASQGRRLLQTPDRGKPWDQCNSCHGMRAAGAARRAGLAASGRDRRRRTRAASLPTKADDEGEAAVTKLGGSPAGVEAAGRHAGIALAGLSRTASQRVRIFPVLRLEPGMGEAPLADDAPDAHCRRADVRGLRRHEAARHRLGDRRGPHG
jgi:hypothetical protein